MKVLFKNMINGYTGNADDYVMYYNRRYNKVIMREKPIFKHHPAHAPFKAVMANLKAINPCQAYREDLTQYLKLYNQLPINKNQNLNSWVNLYQKIMWMMKRMMPEIDLATLTREQIATQNLPCKSINRAINAGILPKVKDYERFNAEM